MATSVASVGTDWTTCSICLEIFDNPKSLPCIHGFCLRCLERYFKDSQPGNKLPCPLCRKRFKIPPDGLGGLQHHFFIQHLVDARNAASRATGQAKCQACLEDADDDLDREDGADTPPATMYCIDCSESLCEKCSRPHRRIKMKGGAHRVRPLGAELEQELLQLRGTNCDKHKEEQVKLYCYDCNENICVLCFAVKHRNHSNGEIPDVAGDFRSRIDEDDKQIVSVISGVRQQLDQTKRDSKTCLGQIDSVEKMIHEASDTAKRLVDDLTQKYLLELKSMKSNCAEQAEVVEKQLQQELVALESFHTFSRELLDKGRPSDVTRAADELHSRATELLDNDDVTSAQFHPPHVTFTPADVTQLSLPQVIGKLTVDNSDDVSSYYDARQTNSVKQWPSVPDVVEKQTDKRSMIQQHQQLPQLQLAASATMPRKLQEEIRRTPVDKDSAMMMEQDMKKRSMGHVLHSLPEGNAVWGVTSLDNRLYVLRNKTSQQIEVYDTQSYRLLQRMTVPLLSTMNDMASCAHNRCLYIADAKASIHRVGLRIVWLSRPDVKQWPVNDVPACISVVPDTKSVMVTCDQARKIKEFSADGKLLRQLALAQNVSSPRHAVQLSNGQLIVCHGRHDDPVHRVCLLGPDSHVARSYGGTQGSGTQCVNVPAHLTADQNKFVFVADHNNYRVLLLSPALTYVREVVSRDRLKWKPLRLFLDAERRRLYVAVNVQVGEFTAGRVVVFNI